METNDLIIDQKEKEKEELFIIIKKKYIENSIEKDEKIRYFSSYYFYSKKNEKKQSFSDKSKYITFKNEEKKFTKTYFIHDKNSLEIALNESEIKNAILKYDEKKNTNYDSNTSKDSNSSSENFDNLNVDEILKNLVNTIEQEKAIKSEKIFSQINLSKRFEADCIYELDFNYKYYYKTITQNIEIEDRNEHDLWTQDIEKFYQNNFEYQLIILGPRGVGKTTTLLLYLTYKQIPRLYFSIKKMSTLNNRKWRKIALNESLYIFKNQNEMDEFIKVVDKIPNSQDLLEFIFQYIRFIFEFYKNKKLNNRILIALDDYDQLYDSNNYIVNIIKYIYENKNIFALCILGESSFIYKKYYNYILNKIYDYKAVYWNINTQNNQDDNLLSLPLYNYRYKYTNNSNEKINIDSFKDQITEEIKIEFKKINLNTFLLLSKYLDSYINIVDLENEFENLPLHFLAIEIRKENEDIFIKFEFKLNIYEDIFNKSIKGLLKIENIKSCFLLNKDEDNRGKFGINFEDIIIEQLWNNQFNCIQFPDKNKIKINNSIYSIKDNTNEKYAIETKKPVIIRQKNFGGKFYDLLLILQKEGKNYAVFIQIGLSKARDNISLYYNNLYNLYDEYIKGIKFLINDNIESLGFMLIFDFVKQIELRKKNNKSNGVEFCLQSKIEFLIYKDYQLYKNLDSDKPIDSLIVTENMLVFEEKKPKGIDTIRNILNNFYKDMSLINSNSSVPINKLEKDIILNYINKEYDEEFTDLDFIMNIDEDIEGIQNFGILSKQNFDKINIYNDKKNKKKYISLNNDIKKIGKKGIEGLNNLENNQIKQSKMSWDLYLLSKKRKRK